MLNNKKSTSKIIITLVLLMLALIWILPILFVFLNLFKGRIEYNMGRGSFWRLPEGNNFTDNFKNIIYGLPLFNGVFNSLIYALFGSLSSLIIGTLAAYGLSHLNIKHKGFWFLFIYSGTVFPFQLYLIPIYKAYNTIGFYDTRIGMILFYTAICIPFIMFVMRNNFLEIDAEITESAKIEGATNFQILIQLFLPMVKASLSVVFLTQFAWSWNDLMFGLTFTKSDNVKTIMSILSVMDKNNPPLLFLACVIASIPTIALFSFLQKNCEKGLLYTSK